MQNNFENKQAYEYLKGLENNSVDLILTDPPYAISKETNFLNTALKGNDTDRFRVSYDFGEWDTVDLQYFESVFKEAYRVLKPGGTCIIFYDIWKMQELKELLENKKFRMFRYIEWVKTNPVPINSSVNYLSNAREAAVVCVKGSKPTFNAKYHKGIFEYPIYHAADRFHTTQKNLQLFEELVSIHSNEGDVILDFFSGSATTQVAALKQGRKYLGCEVDTDIYEKASKRISSYEQNTNAETNEKDAESVADFRLEP